MPLIPKILHHIWLSEDPKPNLVLQCLASWTKAMPGFTVKEWRLKDFDQYALPLFVRQAIEARQWAFAADVLRLMVIAQEGGFYLDADLQVMRSLEPLLGYECVTAIEFHPEIFIKERVAWIVDGNGRRILSRCPGPPPAIGIQAALLGAVPWHPLILSCLDYYRDRDFAEDSGKLYRGLIAPGIYGMVAERFGFCWINSFQKLDHGIVVLPASMVASTPALCGPDAFAVHHCAGSWYLS